MGLRPCRANWVAMNAAAFRFPKVSVRRPCMSSLASVRTCASSSVAWMELLPGAVSVGCPDAIPVMAKVVTNNVNLIRV